MPEKNVFSKSEISSDTRAPIGRLIVASLWVLLGLALFAFAVYVIIEVGVGGSYKNRDEYGMIASDGYVIGSWAAAGGLFLAALGLRVFVPGFDRGRAYVCFALFFVVLTVLARPWAMTRPGLGLGTPIASGVTAVRRMITVGDMLKVTVPLFAALYGLFARRDSTLGSGWRWGANVGLFGGIVGVLIGLVALAAAIW